MLSEKIFEKQLINLKHTWNIFLNSFCMILKENSYPKI